MEKLITRYCRTSKLPHIWCPGCGNGTIMAAIIRALDKTNVNQDKTVVVSGIGCSSRAPGYMNFDTLHTTHGRALAYATGIKMANPELNVIVITGDGDCAAIGGNHLIHAARRNINLTVVVFNNSIYGMTGGQFSPLTPAHAYASTAPYGSIDRNFDLCQLAKAAGGTYVARGTTYHTRQLVGLIANGLNHVGFSFIEAITQCPMYYGRKNEFPTAIDMLKWQRDHAVNVKAAEKLNPDQLEGKFLIGELHREQAPEYTAVYEKEIVAKVRGETR
ncbi:MAG TPA: 2-oxoacid:ferredoxin oxidoreductase subunit beta [bacterium]|nr:2-oxoacid:ferredoxin oxidoreductase subunit beta [bacterium]